MMTSESSDSTDVSAPAATANGIDAPVAAVRTRGLRWNLDGQGLAFGGLVSSSNRVVDPAVRIETSGPLLWMTELREVEGGGRSLL